MAEVSTRPIRALVGVLGVTLAALVTLVGPAQAHAQLESSDPADGATLASAPTAVTFTFGEALLADTETLSINDENGNVVATQSVTPEGSKVTMPWPAELGPGTYQVAYRVVSSDGHPVMGAVTFTITGDAAATTASTPSTTDSTPSPATTPATTPASAPATPTTEGAGATPSVIVVVLVALVVLALIVLVAVRLVRKPR